MKRKNKFLALLLAAALSFSVSACGSADSTDADAGNTSTEDQADNQETDIFAAAQENVKNISSLNGKMTMDMDMNITANGASQSMQTVSTIDMSCFYNPTRFKIDMNVDAGEAGTTTTTMYADTDDDGTCTMYINDGTSWQAQQVDLSDLGQYDAAGSLTEYMQDIYHFQDAGTEQVDGKNTRKYTGSITGDDMKEAMMSTGALNSLSSLGIDESQMDSLFKDLGDLPITMWIDEAECFPVKYELDMASLMNTLMENMMNAAGDQAGDAAIEFSKMQAVMTFSDYNSAEEFSIPDEAKSAAPAA